MKMAKQMFDKQTFDWPSLTRENREDFDQRGLSTFLPVYHTLVHIKVWLFMMIVPFLEQAFYLNSSKQLRGKSRFFPSLPILKK